MKEKKKWYTGSCWNSEFGSVDSSFVSCSVRPIELFEQSFVKLFDLRFVSPENKTFLVTEDWRSWRDERQVNEWNAKERRTSSSNAECDWLASLICHGQLLKHLLFETRRSDQLDYDEVQANSIQRASQEVWECQALPPTSHFRKIKKLFQHENVSSFKKIKIETLTWQILLNWESVFFETEASSLRCDNHWETFRKWRSELLW